MLLAARAGPSVTAFMMSKNGALGRTRTCDARLRTAALWSPELRGRRPIRRRRRVYPRYNWPLPPEAAPSGRSSARLERTVRDREVGGSNPLAPILQDRIFELPGDRRHHLGDGLSPRRLRDAIANTGWANPTQRQCGRSPPGPRIASGSLTRVGSRHAEPGGRKTVWKSVAPADRPTQNSTPRCPG